LSSNSEKTGMKAPLSAESAKSERTVFGIRNASVNADAAPLVPKYFAAMTSRARPAMRESPVIEPKIAVLRAVEARAASGSSSRGAPSSASVSLTAAFANGYW
jgi:hypothetical protein